MSSRIPPLLEPYLQLPPETSLLVLSSVLGASTNWLIQRHLYALLANRSSNLSDDIADGEESNETAVVLVSFLRDYAFWKEGAGRIGVDLDALAKKGRFLFVDGLSELWSEPSSASSPSPRVPRPPVSLSANQRVLRGIPGQALRNELFEAVLELQLQRQRPQRVVLVIDNPDVLLATTGADMTGESLREIILDVREKVHSTIITLAADEPLVAEQTTSVEKQNAAFTLSIVHEAEMVVSLRLLDTGTARDVSGVMRITSGGSATGFVSEERELLYFVGGDGGIRVFERGQ
ncbi:hypothetical protein BX600DRAFT_303619 [Xylariales sp. PMI_506]|nr:hypothetical protein BX600DRAFT_303619 [Xylariales sp. PMI_506]